MRGTENIGRSSKAFFRFGVKPLLALEYDKDLYLQGRPARGSSLGERGFLIVQI